LSGAAGSDDLLRFPPASAIPGFCDCSGIPYFFVKINGHINNNSLIELNTLNDLQISKLKRWFVKALLCPVLPVLDYIVGCMRVHL